MPRIYETEEAIKNALNILAQASKDIGKIQTNIEESVIFLRQETPDARLIHGVEHHLPTLNQNLRFDQEIIKHFTSELEILMDRLAVQEYYE